MKTRALNDKVYTSKTSDSNIRVLGILVVPFGTEQGLFYCTHRVMLVLGLGVPRKSNK